jgi:hypothetical protein
VTDHAEHGEDPAGAGAGAGAAGGARTIVRASWAGTAVFAATAAAAVATQPARLPAVTVAATLFALGIGVFFWAYAIAVGRSRTDSIGIGGLFFLAGEGTAPDPSHKRQLLASLAAQTVTALASAGARPFTTLAFGVLVPLYGLALTGLYGARHGRFAPRPTRR